MSVDLDLQVSEQVVSSVPSHDDFVRWVTAALEVAAYQGRLAEVSVRVVDEAEIQDLNAQYRGKNKPTNVLSFPAEIPDFVESELLGDIVLCARVVELESEQQGKLIPHHWAHLTVHGCLHLLGFDHIETADAEHMEALEVNALSRFNITDPYLGSTELS